MTILDLFGTFVFAYTGARFFIIEKRSISVVFFAAGLTAVGGGTIREIVLQTDQLFWIEDMRYLLLILVAIPCAYLSVRSISIDLNLESLLNNLSTGIFVAIGVQAAWSHQSPLLVMLTMGVLTGIGGGILRDCVLRREFLMNLLRIPFITVSVASMIVTVLLGFGSDAIIALLAISPLMMMSGILEKSMFRSFHVSRA